ncbi:sulfite exporter TauE/SafE family protein [Salinicoccus bachuensis]|uniref:Probable membrane transporter protein n=1 Tax=Salinicoccus bachuensis TaxID=3136731 RepID=A0ABZ3CI32_9STAP
MDATFIIMIFLIGFIGSFISGMVGIGGSIIKYPMLLYLPSMLGIAAFSSHEVAGISAVQVFFATIAGVWAYKSSGYLNMRLIAYMGGAILIGSLLGGYGSEFLTETQIDIVYAVLATIAVIMMFLPKKELPFHPGDDLDFNGPLAAALAFITGAAAGIVGAAGAFILVPIMLVLLKIPTRVTIATSLAVTFISSIGTTIGKVATDQVLYGPAAIMIVASLIAAPLGAKAGQNMDTRILQWILALLILGTAVKIWTEVLM